MSAASAIAIDTNVLIRVLTGDDPAQARRARRLVDEREILLLTSVALETAWVLTRRIGLSSRDAAAALRQFIALPTVRLQHEIAVQEALALVDQGMEIADAIHVCSARDCAAFVTFDKALIKQAARQTPVPVRGP